MRLKQYHFGVVVEVGNLFFLLMWVSVRVAGETSEKFHRFGHQGGRIGRVVERMSNYLQIRETVKAGQGTSGLIIAA